MQTQVPLAPPSRPLVPNTPALKAARSRLKLTQLALSRLVGCSESKIAKIETGRATPDSELRQALARELQIAPWEVAR